MDRLYVKDIRDLAQYMVHSVEHNCYVVATLFFEGAKELMRELLTEYELEIGFIDLTNFEYSGYEGEYYVSITDDGVLSVERAWSDGMYLLTDADLILIDGDASNAIVERNKGSEFVEICFGEDEFYEDDSEDECCCDCCGCHESKDDCYGLLGHGDPLYDENRNIIGVRIDVDDLFDYLFGM